LATTPDNPANIAYRLAKIFVFDKLKIAQFILERFLNSYIFIVTRC